MTVSDTNTHANLAEAVLPGARQRPYRRQYGQVERRRNECFRRQMGEHQQRQCCRYP